ncbi:hypothetical protein [Actinophytocola oryzae]|uniref:hypothetical protein n=1 Tax=Actinophytocola oryzae TaxID=502181 RepID=UPI0010631E7E|nr:hypothetical protein [Actinophytocola oryzae]
MDRELAAALAGELPAAANIKVDDAVPVSVACPPGARGAAFPLPDGEISVILMPRDTSAATDSGGDGAKATATTTGGLLVLVASTPDSPDDTVPYASDLSRFATAVARIY